jgi:hypothetical protein
MTLNQMIKKNIKEFIEAYENQFKKTWLVSTRCV